jgi:hypothetical protein
LGALVPVGDTTEASLLSAREAVWRDYFANGPNLAITLPAGFIGIAAGDTAWEDRAATLASAKASVARGTKLVSLRFPRNVIERYGTIAVVHSRYEAVLEGPTGPTTMRGNITEVFRWDGKRWLHPSWHMDFDRS